MCLYSCNNNIIAQINHSKCKTRIPLIIVQRIILVSLFIHYVSYAGKCGGQKILWVIAGLLETYKSSQNCSRHVFCQSVYSFRGQWTRTKGPSGHCWVICFKQWRKYYMYFL